jgi:hypothetical protein
MLRRFFHSQFFSKLFIELLPATIASAIGAYLINSYFRPQPANTEMVQILREQQTLLADYLKKSTEAHQRADQAVAQETDKLKAAERDALMALREAKAAELRALAAAVTRAGEASERKLAVKPAAAPVTTSALPQWPKIDRAQTERVQAERVPAEKPATENVMISEPLQLHQPAGALPQPQVPAQAQNHPQAQPQPAPPQQAAAEETGHGPIGMLKGTVSKLERLPSRVFGWFSDTVVPPRPPSDLPPRQFMKAAM